MMREEECSWIKVRQLVRRHAAGGPIDSPVLSPNEQATRRPSSNPRTPRITPRITPPRMMMVKPLSVPKLTQYKSQSSYIKVKD